MRAIRLVVAIACGLTLALSLAGGQTRISEADIKALEAELDLIRRVLKQTEDGNHYIIMARLGPELNLPVIVNKDTLIAMLTNCVLMGEVRASSVSYVANTIRKDTPKHRDELARRRAAIEALIRKARSANRPTGPRPSGFWRLKSGYPKINPLATDWQKHGGRFGTVECDIQEGAVEWHYTGRHGMTGQVVNDYTTSCNLSRLPTTMDPGQTVEIRLNATWSYAKDAGRLEGADWLLGWRGFEFVGATPALRGVSGSAAARARVGRWSKDVATQDERTIVLKAPPSGKELFVSFGWYGKGEMIHWMWEWVAL